METINTDDQAYTTERGAKDGKHMTLSEVALYFGCTRERVRQIESSALDKCRMFCRREGLHLDELLGGAHVLPPKPDAVREAKRKKAAKRYRERHAVRIKEEQARYRENRKSAAIDCVMTPRTPKTYDEDMAAYREERSNRKHKGRITRTRKGGSLPSSFDVYDDDKQE